MEVLQDIFSNFIIFNKNAFYYICYFLKEQWMLVFTLAAIFLLVYFEAKALSDKFVDDERNIL